MFLHKDLQVKTETIKKIKNCIKIKKPLIGYILFSWIGLTGFIVLTINSNTIRIYSSNTRV
jgi:hypothetical protein